MIVENKEGLDYLNKLRDGTLELGLGIGCALDKNLMFKRQQLVFNNGLDNVGKTYFMVWYMLCLTVKHNLTWTVYSTENSIAKIKRDLIHFLANENIVDLDEALYRHYFTYVSEHFKFISTENIYTFDEILDLFKQSSTDGYLIDPLTALINGTIKINKHETDNENMLKLRAWLNKNNKTVYINTHVSNEAARRRHPDGNEYEGLPHPRNKQDNEGGQKMANRADDFLTTHRYTQHEHHWMYTHIHVRKVKDTITGGMPTMNEEPIVLKHNADFSFTIGGINPLKTEEKQEDIFTEKSEAPF